MLRMKAMFSVAGLLIACFLLYKFLPLQTKEVSVEAPIVNNQQSGNQPVDAAAEEVEQLEAETDIPVTEEIKEKVREIVEGALNLFKKDQRIVAIGDSLTQGVGDETDGGGYVGILDNTFDNHNLNISIENYGKRGNRTDQLLKRLDNEEIAASIKDADVVLITIGANDIMKIVKNNLFNLKIEDFHSEKELYEERLRAIFTKIHGLNPEVQMYLIGFYNPFQYYFSDIEELDIILNTWNEAGISVTEEFEQLYYIPTADLFVGSDSSLLAEDQFHPNTSGYKLMAKRVLDYLKENREDTEMLTENIELEH